jgi:hypothetical protein
MLDIPYTVNKLYLSSDMMNMLKVENYKEFKNFNSLKEVHQFITYLSKTPDYAIFELDTGKIYESRLGTFEEKYKTGYRFLKLEDYNAFMEMYNQYKDVTILDIDWLYEVIGFYRLICCFGEDTWVGYNIMK